MLSQLGCDRTVAPQHRRLNDADDTINHQREHAGNEKKCVDLGRVEVLLG